MLRATLLLISTDITGTDPYLDALRNNGGPAFTQALLPGSPAIDGGNPGGCVGPGGLLATDERGRRRFGRCDIGAYEAQALDVSDKTVNQPTSLPSQPVRYTISLGNSGAGVIPNVMVTDTIPTGLNYVSGTLSAAGGTEDQVLWHPGWQPTGNCGRRRGFAPDCANGPAAAVRGHAAV